MNVRVHRAVSDIDGVTGMTILRAIVDGERDPTKVAKLRDWRCRKNEEEIANSSAGTGVRTTCSVCGSRCKCTTLSDSTLPITTKRSYESSRRCSARSAKHSVAEVNNLHKGRAIKKRGEEPMRQALYRMSGVDLTCIDAIGVETVQVVISEYGPTLSDFPRRNTSSRMSH